MLLATTEQQFHRRGLRPVRTQAWGLVAGLQGPRDVLTHPKLAPEDKRAVLTAWLSDASAVQDQPHMRWLLGTPEPVPAGDIRDALTQLDRTDRRD